MKSIKIVSSVALAMGLLTAGVSANTVSIIGNGTGSTENTGSTFTGQICYDFNAAQSRGELQIDLSNTSSVNSELTGFLFNVNGAFSSISLQSASAPFTLVTNENGAPFGTFEAGAALGGNFTGGGNPNPGIDDGASGSFTFFLTGGDVATLTAEDFISEVSSGNSNNSAAFLVRFKQVGADGEGSDKVPGVGVPTQPPVIPTPAALPAGLLALGLIGLRRRRLA